ncbi:MAG: 2-oxoglutarate dehydrogenase complex dihydrolipoyllysine-residue succinyltransferase [Candidatus Binatia bacterium]
MPIPLKIPEVGESISEVAIGEWLKSEGDHVERDEEIVVIETEKATVQISAPQSGTITKILKQTGDSARVGEVIGHLEEGRVATQPAKDEAKSRDGEIKPFPQKTDETSTEKLRPESPERVEIIPDAKKDEARDKSSEEAEDAGEAMGSPRPKQGFRGKPAAAAAFSADDEPEPRAIRQTAGQAREDAKRQTKPAPDPARGFRQPYRDRPEETETRSAISQAGEPGGREETIVRMTPLRRRIAERLVQAQQAAALLTTFNEIDMSAVIDLRDRYRDSFRERYNVKLGFMSFFVKAAVEALKLIPEVNAEIRDEDIVYHNFFDIGVAVGGGKGLVVPVLRNAERLSFADIERAIADFAGRAQENRLKPDELQGGTFTISNGGIYGSLLSTPIINPPQSGILGMHAIQERPVVRNGRVVVRPMMYVAVTYDHRIVDGREAVTFLKHIRGLVEDPARILLGT